MNVTLVKKITPLVAALTLSACATIYTDDNFKEYQDTHKEVAIIPFDVIISSRKLPDAIDLATLKSMKEDEGLNFQKQLYSQYLKRWSKGAYTVKFQDVDETNILLRRANMDYDNIRNYTKSEIGQALGVDAVISGTVKREKPWSVESAVVTALLFGFAGRTNSVAVTMTIHDSQEGDILWSYDHDFDGGLAQSSQSMSKYLITQSSRKFPYKTPNK